VVVALTEVEAYEGESDAASHAYRGMRPRNAVMFGPAGALYVYRSHGLHWCCNLVTGDSGEASAVLLRAGRVIEGVEVARERRGGIVGRPLARGPGCLGQALGVTGADNGADLLSKGGRLELVPDPTPTDRRAVLSGPRVGVSLAHDVPWRFWLEGEPSVSAYRRSPRAPLSGSSGR
jgi:DNA-3-methyladenine glycosylase